MNAPELDRIDRRILDTLQRQGRLPMTDLAQEVGLSTSPVTERVRRLERAGVITGYHARVDPAALGRPLLVFVELTLSSKSGELFEKLRAELLHEPRVLECHLVSGRFDYLIKARLSAMSEYRELLAQILQKSPRAGAEQQLRGDGRDQGGADAAGGCAGMIRAD